MNNYNGIYDFIETLTVEDIGKEPVDDGIVCFEGFTDECWDHARERGLTIEEIENEILSQWKNETGLELLFSDWSLDGNIFFAVYG